MLMWFIIKFQPTITWIQYNSKDKSLVMDSTSWQQSRARQRFCNCSDIHVGDCSKLKKLTIKFSNIHTIYFGAFACLNKLEILTMKFCEVQHLSEGIFLPLHSLHKLKMQCEFRHNNTENTLWGIIHILIIASYHLNKDIATLQIPRSLPTRLTARVIACLMD